jgi:hypothetical protein
MFVQVLRGHATDREGVMRMLDQWKTELSPTAEGWLGTTAGVTDDGRFIGSFRFEDAELAQRNSDRAEQTAWWNEFSKFVDSPRFWDCTEVDTHRKGGSDDAGFVQVIMCRVLHPQEFRNEVNSMAASPRADVIGSIVAWQGSRFTEFVYFTSEEEARAGERGEHQQASLELIWPRTEDIEYFDLRQPWYASP